jgi:DNA-binding response OmpR family regulator
MFAQKSGLCAHTMSRFKRFHRPHFLRCPLLAGWILLFLCATIPIAAQNRAIADTIQNRIVLLTQLNQSQNFEQAQVEAEWLRDFLKRHEQPISPKALRLISNIYKANADDRSATRMLAEAELSARKEPNLETKAALLSVLVDECRRWELTDQALNCQQMLSTAQDSIAVRRQRVASNELQVQMDSLTQLRASELAAKKDFFQLKRNDALLLGGALALLFLLLLIQLSRTGDRWRKTLEKKELEWELLKSNLQHEAQENALVSAAQAVEEAQKTSPVIAVNDPYTMYHGPKPEQIALLIEPNRQVVLYLKSLLSDRFQIETAFTANEGMQMANEMLPDLVVCDAVLNGQTGIDIARQIKLSERTNHIPVVLLTHRFGNEGKLDALRAGADAWFTRPVIDDEFDASVQRLLDTRKVKHEQFSRFQQLWFTDNRLTLSDPFLMHTVQMIEQHLADPDFMADDIARKLQMTKTHYAKKLKVLTGKEPVQLIREMRLEKAKVLLEKRAGTPQAISEMVGFVNPGTFALAFKEYFGEHTLLLYSAPKNPYL